MLYLYSHSFLYFYKQKIATDAKDTTCEKINRKYDLPCP